MFYATTDKLTPNCSYGRADDKLEDYFDAALQELASEAETTVRPHSPFSLNHAGV